MNKWKAQEKVWKHKNANGKESSPAEVSVCADEGGDGAEGRPELCLNTVFRSLSLTLEGGEATGGLSTQLVLVVLSDRGRWASL